MPATKDSMLREFEKLVYKDNWGVKPSVTLPAPRDAKYISDLATIGAFLHPENPDFCKALEKLDDAMIKLFEERTATSFKKSKYTLKSFSDFSHGRDSGKPELAATKHLLTVVLARHEVSEGFQGIETETGKCVSFYNNLVGDEFGGAIKSKHLAKDYVGDAHGAYTHRIQWYCAGVMKKELGLVSATMSDCFKSSGRVWGLVFDRNGGEGVEVLKDDFRRPELMNPWIASTARYGNHCWPVLSAFLKSRLDRLSRRGWAPDVLRINLAAKLFPDKAKPSVDYRKATAQKNVQELAGFNLSGDEMALLDKAVKGVSYDPLSGAAVSFSGGVKKALT